MNRLTAHVHLRSDVNMETNQLSYNVLLLGLTETFGAYTCLRDCDFTNQTNLVR